ncbi:MAG: peptidylprolyl isomerase [Longimicrobiales bacterium]|nr:peptidylprolyl isomerase [Longimicrobiales bacterium]
MKTIRTALPLALALALLPSTLAAQFTEGGDVVDRLVAVVGDSVVVQTQVEEEIQRMALSGRPIPQRGDPEYQRLFRTVLDQFVDRLLILQAAAKDSLIQVDAAVLDDRVNERLNQLTQQFGGQTALQQALAAEGMTLAEYRDLLRSEARIERIQQLFMQLRLRDSAPVEVSEEELLARFQEARATLQQRPRTVRFRQVVIAPEPSEEARTAARDQAQALLDSIRAGADFAELARRYSDDPGTAELGGDLGWFRRGRMVREFEDAAFALFDGEVSDLVETDFGYHIIKVERWRAGERNARHILIVPETTQNDASRALTMAEEVAAQLRSGASAEALNEEYGDPAAPDSITMAFDQLAELPPVYGAIRSASEGDVLGPLQYEVGPNELRYAVVKVAEIREAGAYTFEDLRDQIANQVRQEKRIETLLEDLRARTYIDIRVPA